jgi:hypothetical protein
MAATHLIAARVTTETKTRFKALADREQVTESVLLKQLIELQLRMGSHTEEEGLRTSRRPVRDMRLYVRLEIDDQVLLRDRAEARQMAAATYVSVLVHAHLRNLAPLPKAELMALKRSIAELGAIGRLMNQIARAANQGAQDARPEMDHTQMIYRLCVGMREHVKSLIEANTHSWESGYE